jgi:hypothetical protein
MDQLKSAVTARGILPWNNIKTGVSINWSRHCGCVGTYDPDPIVYNTTYGQFFEGMEQQTLTKPSIAIGLHCGDVGS